MGISYSSLWRQLNGSRKLKAETVAKIAFLTGKTPNDILEMQPQASRSSELQKTKGENS